ncbi:hypothetical protein BKA63DRAFT_594509 [Paraphoma chrysanthemicola]|nr:hypothetical protein BKA63DRAFT_594509 [Paraphoma chrysanthemicola]
MPSSSVEQAFLASKAIEHISSVEPVQTSKGQSRNHDLAHRWRSSWQAPATMIGFLLSGGALAMGHHHFYRSLSNTRTPDNFSQQMNTAYGTALAFLAKACMIAAVGSAYTQYIWFDFRKKCIRISTIDSTFTATSSIISLLDYQFIWSCKVGAVLAALMWLLPLAAIVTPATLSVRPTISSTTFDRVVPTLNFSTFNELREGMAVQSQLTRLSKLVTAGVQIPPVPAFVANTSYDLEIVGPSLKCGTPSSDVTENIDAIFEATGGSVRKWNESAYPMAVYIAFTPFTPWTYSGRAWPLNDIGQTRTNSSDWTRFVDLCLKNSQPYCSLLGPTLFGIPDGSIRGFGKRINTANALWLRFGDKRLSCSVQRTRYLLNFDAHNPFTALKRYSYVQEGVFETEILENSGSVIAVQPLLDILRGSTYMTSRLCLLSEMQSEKCSTAFNYVVSQTSIHETALTAMISEKAGEIRNKTWDISLASHGGGVSAPLDPIPFANPLDIPLTRNLNLGEIIEEMSRNLTLSYFSDARYLSPNGTEATVTTTMPVNVYYYNMQNLVIAYTIAFGLSTLAVSIGLYMFVANGYLNGTANFSTILCATTRNPGLGNIIERASTTVDAKRNPPSIVAGPDVLKMRLKYGVLLDDHISDVERREAGDLDERNIKAFGVPGQVL